MSPSCTGKLIRYCTMAETLEIFDVDRWLRQPRPAELHVSQPYQVACWSKSSFNEGGETCHGDTAGKSCMPGDLPTACPHSAYVLPQVSILSKLLSSLRILVKATRKHTLRKTKICLLGLSLWRQRLQRFVYAVETCLKHVIPAKIHCNVAGRLARSM